jgi:hypothetical protein
MNSKEDLAAMFEALFQEKEVVKKPEPEPAPEEWEETVSQIHTTLKGRCLPLTERDDW